MVFCGTDIIEVERVKHYIEADEKFLKKVFSAAEIECVEKFKSDYRYQKYAARFAAKEAIFKALSKVLISEKMLFDFSDLEILNSDDNNRPYVNFLKMELKQIIQKRAISIDISLSHLKEYAMATAVVEI